MKTYRIAVIAGDGIGKEVIPAGIDVLRMAADQGGFRLDFTDVPWGCDYYLQTGRMMDANGIDQLMKFDAIYLGAIGDPRVSDAVSARELILPLRQQLGQYVNLRPMKLMPGITSPLANRGAAEEGGRRLRPRSVRALSPREAIHERHMLAPFAGEKVLEARPTRAVLVGRSV